MFCRCTFSQFTCFTFLETVKIPTAVGLCYSWVYQPAFCSVSQNLFRNRFQRHAKIAGENVFVQQFVLLLGHGDWGRYIGCGDKAQSLFFHLYRVFFICLLVKLSNFLRMVTKMLTADQNEIRITRAGMSSLRWPIQFRS